MAERPAIFTVIVGKPGCGKTSLMLDKFIPAIGKDKTLIIDPDGLEEKWQRFPRVDVMDDKAIQNLKGIAWSYANASDYNAMFEKIQRNFRNGLLLMDDVRVYCRSNVEEALRNMLRRKRQMMADIVVAAHGFTEVPPAFFPFATDYILFPTMDNINKRKNELHPFEAFLKRKERVDKTSWRTKNPHYFEYFSKEELTSEI